MDNYNRKRSKREDNAMSLVDTEDLNQDVEPIKK